VKTNIVVFGHGDTDALARHMASEGIRIGTIAPGVARLVTHRDVGDDGLARACQAVASAP
jgi:NAD(P)-dependent dehydrogenase (short-subunit alcohol dehydrogenase family)